MALVHINDVSRATLDPEALWGFAIDDPSPGDQSKMWAFQLRGWVLGKRAPAVEVECLHDEVLLRTIPINKLRPDVGQAYRHVAGAERGGFQAPVGVIGTPAEFDIHVRVRCSDRTYVPLGIVHGVHEPLRSRFRPRLQPLMVTTLGRTGSTWLVCVLAQHPGIVAERRYPYELFAAGYWVQMLRVLGQPADHIRSTQPATFRSESWFIGHNPYYTEALTPLTPPFRRLPNYWLGGGYVRELAAFCQRSIDAYYRRIARIQLQNSPRYFMEKQHPWHIPRMLWELYPKAREIFLVRDFRDMVCSVLSFNAKRGYAAFGRESFSNDEAYVRSRRAHALHLLHSWQSRRRQAHLLRYEDLVLRPEQTVSAILDYLGLDSSRQTVREMLARAAAETPDLPQHRTAPAPELSVSRWRGDLSPSLKRISEETFGDILQAFGYESGAVAEPEPAEGERVSNSRGVGEPPPPAVTSASSP
jgi:hypothetical protein